MLVSTKSILEKAQAQKYAVAAFNIYNLEGIISVVNAAEQIEAPVILQLHSATSNLWGLELASLCLSAANKSKVDISVHFDHASSEETINQAINLGIKSIMVDGSFMGYQDNIDFTQFHTKKIHSINGFVEAELGRLSGIEDGLSVPEKNARMTNPEQLFDFCSNTKIDALAVCVGNVHGEYMLDPNIDFLRLEKIRSVSTIPLVMHGASGLPVNIIKRCIDLGISKFNINTELRNGYTKTIINLDKKSDLDILDIMNKTILEMTKIAAEKIKLFSRG